MKTYEEMANDVLKRRDKYFAEKKRRIKTMMTVLPTLAVVLIASAAIGLNKNIKPPFSPTAATAGQTEEATTKAEEKERKTISNFASDFQSCYSTPEPGTYFCFHEVTAAREYYNYSNDVNYVLSLDIFSKEEVLSGDMLEKEYKRLSEKGYKLYNCQWWQYQGKNAEKVYSDIVVGVFTEEELNSFDVNPEYGYAFYFVTNGNGSPLTFDESTATPWTYKAE